MLQVKKSGETGKNSEIIQATNGSTIKQLVKVNQVDIAKWPVYKKSTVLTSYSCVAHQRVLKWLNFFLPLEKRWHNIIGNNHWMTESHTFMIVQKQCKCFIEKKNFCVFFHISFIQCICKTKHLICACLLIHFRWTIFCTL